MKLAETRAPVLPLNENHSARAIVAEPRLRPGPARKGLVSTDPGPALPVIPNGEALFYVNSLVGQVWLLQLRKRIQARYAAEDQGERPALQTGYAWRSFSTFFEPLGAIELVRLFENLLRFANHEPYLPARSFFLAYAPLAFEHDFDGQYIGPGVWDPQAGSKRAAQRVRRTLRRWCEWLEALTHFQVHSACHPVSPHHELDKAIILLWPLFKQHHWSFADLLGVLGARTQFAQIFPCQSDVQLANYSRKVLGLRSSRKASHGNPRASAGQAVAERLLNFLPTIV